MKFTKGFFFIQQVVGASEPFVIRKGWLSDDYSWGFHKEKNKWIATDIASGMEICVCETRKECAEWVESHLDDIDLARSYKKHIEAVEAMRQYCLAEIE